MRNKWRSGEILEEEYDKYLDSDNEEEVISLDEILGF